MASLVKMIMIVLISTWSAQVYANMGEGGDSQRVIALWCIILLALVIEYFLINKLFAVNKIVTSFVISAISLLTSGSFYLVVLLLINIVLVLAQLESTLWINIFVGGFIMSSSKIIIYQLIFKLPMSSLRFIGAVVSSLLVVSLFCSLSLMS